MLKALLFDMDGLMIDTEPIYWDVERVLARQHGVSVSDATLRKMMGRSRLDSMRIFLADCGITRCTVEALLVTREQLMLERYAAGVEPMPGLHETLARFHSRLKLAVVTSSPRIFTDVLLPALKVDDYFEVVQTGDDIERGKPDPQIYLRAMSRLNVEPPECAVLEDSHSGALAAHRAGAFVIAIPTALTAHEDFSFTQARTQNLMEAIPLIEARLRAG
jgi:HAD superfamily hydrolase (TIGR01509 family)